MDLAILRCITVDDNKHQHVYYRCGRAPSDLEQKSISLACQCERAFACCFICVSRGKVIVFHPDLSSCFNSRGGDEGVCVLYWLAEGINEENGPTPRELTGGMGRWN